MVPGSEELVGDVGGDVTVGARDEDEGALGKGSFFGGEQERHGVFVDGEGEGELIFACACACTG